MKTKEFTEICKIERDSILRLDIASLEALTSKKNHLLDQIEPGTLSLEELENIKGELKRTMSLIAAAQSGLKKARNFLSGKEAEHQYTYSRSLKKHVPSTNENFIKSV